MATVIVRIRLEDGPCNGTNATVERSGDLLPPHTCRGTEYEPTARQTAAGRIIYTPKAAQQTSDTPGTGTTPNKAHGSWHAMLVNMFVDAPKELHSSRKAREAIGGLRHRKGLR